MYRGLFLICWNIITFIYSYVKVEVQSYLPLRQGRIFISGEITQYPFVLFVFKTDFVDHISTEVSLVRPEKLLQCILLYTYSAQPSFKIGPKIWYKANQAALNKHILTLSNKVLIFFLFLVSIYKYAL